MKILFVCTGNTCRSPMAGAIARAFANDRAWEGVEVRSAGTDAVPGEPASGGAVRIAAGHGLDLSDHRATRVTPELASWADLILTMSPNHLMRLIELGAGGRAALLTSFARPGSSSARNPTSVPDPIGGSDRDYEETFRTLETLIQGLFERLEQEVVP